MSIGFPGGSIVDALKSFFLDRFARKERSSRERWQTRHDRLDLVRQLLDDLDQTYSIKAQQAEAKLPAAVAAVADPKLSEAVGQWCAEDQSMRPGHLHNARLRIGELIHENDELMP